MTIAGELAAFISDTSDVPTPALDHAKLAFLDLVTASIAGAGTRVAQISRRAARQIWRAGAAPVWFSGDRLNAPGAALVNSASASALDLDDGHRAASGHPGAASQSGSCPPSCWAMKSRSAPQRRETFQR
jgi:2-methylcitrate dehydratase PrpD